jgi:phage-related protein
MRRTPGRAGSRLTNKPLVWWGSSLRDVRSFPADARRDAGFQLGQLQEGNDADDWKPMSIIGRGTIEIRVHTGTEHRIFVVTRFAERIDVIHAFEKKAQRTMRRDIDLAKRRYAQILAEEQRR